MGKRSKCKAATDDLIVENKLVDNKKNKTECSDANNESKPEKTNTTSEDKRVKRKKKSKSQTNEGGAGDVTKNKKYIFNDDDDEAVEVDNPTVQRKRTNHVEFPQENEEDIKDEDIDKFCDELNDEDNEQYESWVKLIEAKLHSNKQKPK